MVRGQFRGRVKLDWDKLNGKTLKSSKLITSEHPTTIYRNYFGDLILILAVKKVVSKQRFFQGEFYLSLVEQWKWKVGGQWVPLRSFFNRFGSFFQQARAARV